MTTFLCFYALGAVAIASLISSFSSVLDDQLSEGIEAGRITEEAIDHYGRGIVINLMIATAALVWPLTLPFIYKGLYAAISGAIRSKLNAQ